MAKGLLELPRVNNSEPLYRWNVR